MMNVPKLIRACLGDSNTLAVSSANRLSRTELDEALNTLVEQNWLVRYGSGDLMSFKVNLRRRAGSQLGQDIWAALGDRIAASKQPDQDAADQQDKEP